MEILGVTDSSFRFLRDKIITGEFASGEKLNEIEVSERIGVSRPPLREAFRKLENEKLVVNIPRKGTYVTEMSSEDCKALSSTRSVLETAAIDTMEAAGFTSFPCLNLAVEAADRYELPARFTTSDIIHHYEVMAKFHCEIVASCQNKWLIHCYQSLQSSLARYQTMYLGMPKTPKASVEAHREILELLEANRYAEAKGKVKSHIATVTQQLIEKLDRKQLAAEFPS